MLVSVIVLMASCGGATAISETGAIDGYTNPTSERTPAAQPAPTSAQERLPAASPTRRSPIPTAPAVSAPTAAQTPTLVPDTDASDPCERGPNGGDTYDMQVVDVARDDPDGGLVVHYTAGVSTPVVDVLAWNTNDIRWNYGRCEILDSGAMWVSVRANGVQGWVNARYLGRRVEPADDLATSPCGAHVGSLLDDEMANRATSETAAIHIDSISVQSTASCDRIVFELANNAVIGSLEPETAVDQFPLASIYSVVTTPHAVEIRLDSEPDPYVAPWPEVWRDSATDELNAALVFVESANETMRVGYGTGSASVRYASDPARVIVDVVQRPTPSGTPVGPMTSGGAIIFDPITPDRSSVSDPLTIRGWSRGFESSSSLRLAAWDQSEASQPENWNGTIFGDNAPGVNATIDPEPPFTPEDGVSYFMTLGHFEFTIDDLEPGAYQLMVSPDTGCGGPSGVVQRFHVGDAAVVHPADWFAMHFAPHDERDGDPVILTDAAGERLIDWPAGRC